MRHPRTITLIVAIATLVATTPVWGGQVVDRRRGEVLPDQRGEAEALELTGAELEEAYRKFERLPVGIVVPPADATSTEVGSIEAMVSAAQRRLAEVGADAPICTVTVDQPTAADCVNVLLADRSLAGLVIIGDHGDLSEVTTDLGQKLVAVGIGPTLLGEGSVRLDVDPVVQATEQGRAAGMALGPVAIKRRGNAVLLHAATQESDDPVSDAVESGLRQTARKVKVSGRVGPPAVRSVEDLEAVLGSLPPVKLAIGEGLELDQADGASLERLPGGLRLIAWRCSDSLMELVDQSSRLRGCVARADDVAGEAAVNVLLDLATGRDVPERIDLPVYVYRGLVPAGPGMVQLGRRVAGTTLGLTTEETDLARASLAGATVGVVVPDAPGDGEDPAVRASRELLEAGIADLGATAQLCITDGSTAKARRCVSDFTQAGVKAIVSVATGADLTGVMNAAVAAGIMVVGVNESRLGDTGAAYVIVNPKSVGRLNGRMAGAYTYAVWREQPVEALVINDRGADGQDYVASSVETALRQANPQVLVVNRIGARDKASAAAAAATIIKKYPTVRILVGQNAHLVAEALGGRKNVNPELTIYALACEPDVVDAIDIGADTGGRMKGCVDRQPSAAGSLGTRVLTKLAAGSTVPEVLESAVSAYDVGP